MKIWFDSEGTSFGGKRYYAVVEEIMVDKDGKPVFVAAPEQVAPVAVAETQNSDELIAKVDEIIAQAEAARDAETVEVVEEVQPETEEVVEVVTEEAPVEEVAEEIPAEEVAEEVPAEPVIIAVTDETAATETEKVPAIRSRNFAEKMRDADEVLQDRYDELKNYALRFRKLKSRISKKFDSINQGRFQFVKLSVAGKTLKLYLNMDINTTDPKFHCKDMSDKKTYVTVPVLLRIKSGRAVKYAKRLIDQCAEQHGMLERRKPFVVDAMALIEEALKGKEQSEEFDDDAIELAESADEFTAENAAVTEAAAAVTPETAEVVADSAENEGTVTSEETAETAAPSEENAGTEATEEVAATEATDNGENE